MAVPFEELRAALADRYALEAQIGRGGMATVFAAEDVKHGRGVALKVLHPELTAALGAERFLREIEIVARLTHPHILPLYDSGRTNGFFYFVMPYVEGESLRQRLEREVQLPVADALGIARAVASALGYAHSHGVVHRDVKPENILFSGDEPVVADFGIARAVTAAGSERLTRTGIAVGTPAYMSPEQATGEEVDARADIYGLGCVLYEMLAGEPPFTGRTRTAVIARHLSERPPSLRVVRPGVPPRVEAIVETALAKAPADRFATAEELAEALGKAGEALTVPGAETDRRRWPWWWIGAAAAVAVVLGTLIPRVFAGDHPSPTHYLVGPLGAAEAPGREALPLGVFRHEFEAALRQVPGIGVPDAMRVNDRLMRAGGEPRDLSWWVEAAAALGAGRLITLRTVPLRAGDSVEVVAEVRDVRRSTLIERADVRLALAGEEDLAYRAAALVEGLFGLTQGVIAARGSRNDEAMRAFVAGREALKTWSLEAAREHFQEAVRLDPDFAQANFWLAQTAAWADEAPQEWSGAARRAAARSDGLADGREAALARGLLALADGRFPTACETYGALIAADSLDFHAWFGLGECHRQDRVVTRDPASPSGWAFRGSYQAAVEAYERALEIAPSFNFALGREAAARLEELLFAEPHQMRGGPPLPPDTGYFAAYPSLDRDTLAFVPWPFGDVLAGKPGTLPATRDRAVEEGRHRLFRVVRNWAASFPDRPAPYRALARGLELRQSLEGGGTETSALAAIRRARDLAGTPEDSLGAALTEVRLLVKLERFPQARELAVEILDRHREPDPPTAFELRGLAALLGRPHRAARLGAAAARRQQEEFSGVLGEVPLPVLEAREKLLAYAAVGAPADSLRAYAARLETLVDVHLAGAPSRVRCELLAAPFALAFPQLGQTVAEDACWSPIPVLEVQWNLGRGDTARAHRLLLEEVRRAEALPGGAIDYAFHRAWLLAGTGDTTLAVGHLDRALGVLPSLGTAVTREPTQAAGLVRALALRAELAARAGDRATARRRAEAVLALWGDGEPEVQPLISRLRALAGGQME